MNPSVYVFVVFLHLGYPNLTHFYAFPPLIVRFSWSFPSLFLHHKSTNNKYHAVVWTFFFHWSFSFLQPDCSLFYCNPCKYKRIDWFDICLALHHMQPPKGGLWINIFLSSFLLVCLCVWFLARHLQLRVIYLNSPGSSYHWISFLQLGTPTPLFGQVHIARK